MIGYLKIIILVLSLAMASAGILVSSHLRTTYKTDFFASLLFFQVFWFTFGFYALWGRIAVDMLLRPMIEPLLLEKIADTTIVAGAPFLVFAWLMYLKFTREITNRKSGGLFIGTFLAINFLLLPGAGYLMIRLAGIQAVILLQYAYILLNMIYILTGCYYMFFVRNLPPRLGITEIRNLALWMTAVIVIQNILFFYSVGQDYFTLAFILIFFSFGVLMPLYFRYRADLSGLLSHSENSLTMELFFKKYEISKREKEVIHEICEGLTNQQIADKLFISLQTVKDHTHRIYSKTYCTSRAQLIRLVNEEK
jgi:DNA-binding CsgD family transcriptional regulator